MKGFQEQKLKIFEKALLEFNNKIPLFSRKEEAKELKKLFMEARISVKILKPVLSKAPLALDIGSGNGFQALPLAIFYPKTQFVLCEKNQKKVEFLYCAKYLLKLSNVEILNQELKDLKKPFDLVFSKATAPLPQVLKLLEGVLSQKGAAFLWKSTTWKKESPLKSNFEIEVFKEYKRSWGSTAGVFLKISRAIRR